MKKMIALSHIEYPPGSCFETGDEFEVADEHVDLFVTLGRAALPRQSDDEQLHRESGTLHLTRRQRRAA